MYRFVRTASASLMVRIVSVLFLIVLFALSSHALADDFIIRNGIRFGDRLYDVLMKEPLGFYSTEPGYEEESWVALTCKGTIAGIPGSRIEYYFDSNKLEEVLYVFNNVPASLEQINIYYFNSVNDALISKYGPPSSQNPDDVFILTSIYYNSACILPYMCNLTGGYGTFDNYAEWIVDCGEYRVKIEHIEYCCGDSYSEAESHHTLTYFYFTDTDVKEAEQKRIEKQMGIVDDL